MNVDAQPKPCVYCRSAAERDGKLPGSVQMPPLFEGAQPLVEHLHEKCAWLLSVRQAYKQVIEVYLNGVGIRPLEEAFKAVLTHNYVGWLDVRRSFSKDHAFEERTTVCMVRPRAEAKRADWIRLPVTPEVVLDILEAMKPEQAPTATEGPDLDVDVSAQQIAP